MKPNGNPTGTSSHAMRAVKRVMSDGQPRDLTEIVEAIHDLPQEEGSGTIYRTRARQIPTQMEMANIGKKLGFTVTRRTRHYDAVVDGERVTFSKRVAVYQMK
mgnify:CR=1 FL=1